VSKPFDAATKHLFGADPGTWMAYANLVPDGPLRVLDTDLSTVSAAVDAVVRVDAPTPWLVDFEFQSSHDGALASRLLRYNVLLGDRHSLPVLTVVILLRPEADGADLKGVFHRRLPNGRLCHEFHYVVVRAWEKPLEDVLTGGVATLPLASLANVSREAMPEVIRRVDERLSREVSSAEAETLWTAFFVLMGLRYPPEYTKPFLDGVRAMLDLRDSSVYQIILEEGREEGREEGIAEGEIKGAIQVLLRLGRDRFGPPNTDVVAALEAIPDLVRVMELTDRLLKVSSWDELLSPT
jgi:hypothetical protein